MKSTIIFWTFCTVSTKKGGRTAFLLYKRVKRKTAGASPPKKALGTERMLTLHTPPQRAAVPRRAAATTARARRGCSARYTPPAPVFRVYAARRYRRARYRGCTPRRVARPHPPGRFPIYAPAARYRGNVPPLRRKRGYTPVPRRVRPPGAARRGTRPRPVRRASRVRRPRHRGTRHPSPPAAPGTRRRFRGAKPCAGVGVVESLQLLGWRPRPPLA